MDERTTANHILHRNTDFIRIQVTIAPGSKDTCKQMFGEKNDKYVHVLIDTMTASKN